MKISFVIPTYNYARFLERCLLSVIQQPAGAYEVVIVDDGSTDETSEVVSKICSQNPNLERAKALQREISDLRAELDQKELDYGLEAREIGPEKRLGSGYGRGHHRDYWGRGGGMGYGPGACRR